MLFLYLAAHLVNHALGLASLSIAEAGLRLSVTLWHSPPGTVLLYGAAGIHVALAFLSVYERRTLRLPPIELLRIAMGFGMPILLIGHFSFTRLAFEAHGLDPSYQRIVSSLWRTDSEGRQLALLVPGWVHGCLGLHLVWVRHGWYQRLRMPLFALAVLLPVLSAIGFLSMGRSLETAPASLHQQGGDASAAPSVSAPSASAPSASAPSALAPAAPASRPDTQAIGQALAERRDQLVTLYFLLIVAVLAARWLRQAVELGRGRLVSIEYPQRRLRVPQGWSVLEASRAYGLPHVALCAGRARCSTCRVRVTTGLDECHPPSTLEQQTLRRVHAAADVRLACQLRPKSSVTVIPLLTPTASRDERVQAAATPAADGATPLAEQEAVMLLVDLRDHDEPDPDRPSHDLLHALQVRTEVAGSRITAAGGQFLMPQSDLAVGLFNRGKAPAQAAQAMAAATAIEAALSDSGNARSEPPHSTSASHRSNIRMLLHHGPLLVGSVGYGPTRQTVLTGRGWLDALAAQDKPPQREPAGAVPSLEITESARKLLPEAAQRSR